MTKLHAAANAACNIDAAVAAAAAAAATAAATVVAAAAAATVVPPPRKPVLLPPPLPAVDFAWRTRDRHLGSGEGDVTGTGHGRFIHCRLRASHRCGCTRVLRRGKSKRGTVLGTLKNQVTRS